MTQAKQVKKVKRPVINVGDTLYLWDSPSFLNRETKRELEEAEVTKVNTASVYVKQGKRELRFDKKTLQYRDGFGGYTQAFVDPNTFYQKWDRDVETRKLREAITAFTKSANYETLKHVHAIYVENRENQ